MGGGGNVVETEMIPQDNVIVLNNMILEFFRLIDLQNIAQFAFLNLEVNVCRLFPALAFYP